MPTEKKSIVPTPTTSAPKPQLLSCGFYNIVPKPTEEGFEYDILCNEQYVGTYPDIYQAIDCFIEHLKNSKSALLDRLKKPEMSFNFFIR